MRDGRLDLRDPVLLIRVELIEHILVRRRREQQLQVQILNRGQCSADV